MSDEKLGLVTYPKGIGPIERQREVDGMRELLDGAIAASTLRMYRSDWRAFCEWCVHRAVDPRGTRPAGLAVYLWWLDAKGLVVGTIRRHFGAIAYFLRKVDPELWARKKEHGEATVAMGAIRRKQRHVPKRKKPVVTGSPLDRMLEAVAANPNRLASARDRAILLVGFCGAFRRSEIVSLKIDDLDFSESGLRITLRRSKTDQEGKGYVKGIPFAKERAHCAVHAVREWLECSGIPDGYIFRRVDRFGRVRGDSISDRFVAEMVKKYVVVAGLGNAKDFAGHSLRSGFVTSAIRAHKNVDAVMRQTGHKTVEVLRDYIRYETVFDDNALDGML